MSFRTEIRNSDILETVERTVKTAEREKGIKCWRGRGRSGDGGEGGTGAEEETKEQGDGRE